MRIGDGVTRGARVRLTVDGDRVVSGATAGAIPANEITRGASSIM